MTPNLGQGGCCAIEDGVVLARSLAAVLKKPAGLSSSNSSEDAVAAALRAYEAARSARCLPLTLRSYAFGAALQLPFAPVVAVRDAFVEAAFRPGHFLDHTSFDVGALR
jgi:2-polyprenyl-6-methoxyphenol hydroxylase-like FAD-dependent oxidoreductase